MFYARLVDKSISQFNMFLSELTSTKPELIMQSLPQLYNKDLHILKIGLEKFCQVYMLRNSNKNLASLEIRLYNVLKKIRIEKFVNIL